MAANLMKHWTLALVCIHALMSSSLADFTIEIEFFGYLNPTHAALGHNGACCDNSGTQSPPNCTNTCDNYFFICLRDLNDTRDIYVSEAEVLSIANETCPYGWIITDELAKNSKDNVRFSAGSLDRTEQTPNPVVFECLSPWPGAIELVVVVVDKDGGRDDIVDIISVSVTDPSPVTIKLNETTPVRDIITVYFGKAFISLIELSHVVNCSENFYGTDCATFCEPRNDSFGHFTCNETSGSIICNEGYTNISVWCTQCIPEDSCSPIGGFCEVPGDCICYDGFRGENCSELLQPNTTNLDNSTNSDSGISLGPPIGGTITGVVILAAIGAVIIVATVGEMRKRKKRAKAKKIIKRARNSELLSNAAYIKTRIQIQDMSTVETPKDIHHEEFETSHNPGYRVVSLGRHWNAKNLLSSYPGTHPASHEYVETKASAPIECPSQESQHEDLYYYSYPNTNQRQLQLNQQGIGVGIYDLEGPYSGNGLTGNDEQISSESCDIETNGEENELVYTYVSTEYVNGLSISPQGFRSHAESMPVKKSKPIPLPRTKKISAPETEAPERIYY